MVSGLEKAASISCCQPSSLFLHEVTMNASCSFLRFAASSSTLLSCARGSFLKVAGASERRTSFCMAEMTAPILA
jgi:hypothetical protein